jgi:hypothetical protein
MILEFFGPEYRLFEVAALYSRWPELAFPQYLKQFTVTAEAIAWNAGGRVDADYLYDNSRPQQRIDLEDQVLLLGYKNQAPSEKHEDHHVYGVFLAPFSSTPFCLGESIGGGFAGTEDASNLTTAELLAWSGWRHHFVSSGCAWAVPLVESLAEKADQLVDTLVSEACKRSGIAEDA